MQESKLELEYGRERGPGQIPIDRSTGGQAEGAGRVEKEAGLAKAIEEQSIQVARQSHRLRKP